MILSVALLHKAVGFAATGKSSRRLLGANIALRFGLLILLHVATVRSLHYNVVAQ
jgi:hypothetical protein